VLTDRPEARFAIGNVLHLEGRPEGLTLTAAQAVEDGPGWRLRFAEISDRAAAERLRDAYLEIEVDRAADLADGAAYWHEVIGSTVRDSAGSVLGRVADVYRAGENEVYVVRDGPLGEFDVPAVRHVVTTFAPERRELVIDESVLDLAAPAVDAPGPPPGRAAREPRRHRWSRHGKGPKPAAARAPDAPDGGGADAPAARDAPAAEAAAGSEGDQGPPGTAESGTT
jgi:16S rRNA processing protein RimM